MKETLQRPGGTPILETSRSQVFHAGLPWHIAHRPESRPRIAAAPNDAPGEEKKGEASESGGEEPSEMIDFNPVPSVISIGGKWTMAMGRSMDFHVPRNGDYDGLMMV